MKPSNKRTSKSLVNYSHSTLSYGMKVLNRRVYQNLLVRRQSNRNNQSGEYKVMSHCGKSMNTLKILIFALLHNFNFDALQ
jgi:hypothetical protein